MAISPSALVERRFLSTCNYIVAGEDSQSQDPPVLILHGVLGNCVNWRTLSKRISSGVNAPVYALDAPNHGESPWVDTMTYESMAEAVVNFMRLKSIDKVRLIGHSMGGKTVMVLAMKYPELVEKLLVVDSSPTPSDGVRAIEGYISAMRSLDLSSISSRSQVSPGLAATVADKGIREFIALNAAMDETTRKLYWRCNIEVIEKFLPVIGSFPKFDHSSSVDTLFIGGTDSQHISQKHHGEIHRLFKNARIAMIAGGHWVHYDNPPDFLRTSISFLNNKDATLS